MWPSNPGPLTYESGALQTVRDCPNHSDLLGWMTLKFTQQLVKISVFSIIFFVIYYDNLLSSFFM